MEQVVYVPIVHHERNRFVSCQANSSSHRKSSASTLSMLVARLSSSASTAAMSLLEIEREVLPSEPGRASQMAWRSLCAVPVSVAA